MFKSKTKFIDFNTHDDKGKELDFNKVKVLAKGAVKKLAAKPGMRAPFHLVLNYFKDEQGKPTGHFLDFGLNKKLTKHFEQVEMKAGKPDKRMSANPKEAATGEAYVKEENGKRLLCFEPAPASKIPAGRWPKILKSLKAFFGGIKAVVVIGGQIIGDEAGNEAAGEAAEPSVDETAGEETPDSDAATDDAQRGPVDASSIKAQLKSITEGLRNTLAKEIVPKVKSRLVELEDQNVVQGLLEEIKAFEGTFEAAEDSVKEQLQRIYDTIKKQVPQVEKIERAIQDLLNDAKEALFGEEEEEDVSFWDELIDRARQGVSDFDEAFDDLKNDLENAAEELIEGGEELLQKLQ